MKKISILCFAIFSYLVMAQHKFLNPPAFSDEYLTKTASEIDSKAPAEILYRSIHFRIDPESGTLERNYHYRVKIYNKEKAEYMLNLEIPVSSSKDHRTEKIIGLKGFTHNLENGKKVSTKVENSSKYKSKEDKYVTINKFAFPNVKDGSVIEYSYTVSSPFIYAIPEITIELDVPSVYTEYVFDTPEHIAYGINYTGNLQPQFRDVAKTNLYTRVYQTYRFGFANVKPFKSENFVKNSDNYRTKVKGELHSTVFNNQFTSYSTSWTAINERLQKDEEFGLELAKQRLTKEFIPADVAALASKPDKADKIFRIVQKMFTWDGSSGIFTDKGFRKLIDTKSGNAADINLFLVAMLREAGLNANPIAISTVENGALNISAPNIASLDFVIAAVEEGGKFYVYDATSKQSATNDLPPRDWNDLGVLLKKSEATPIVLVNTTQSVNTLKLDAKVDEDGLVSGTYKDLDTGAFAMRAKANYDENNEKYKKSYPENFGINFTDINSDIVDNGGFESSMKFEANNFADKVGQKIIINPMLFLGKTKNEFDQTEARLYQIDLVSPFVREKVVNITIPDGYTIEELPKGKKISTQDKEITYSYSASQKGNVLEVVSKVAVASADYPKEYYPAFKQIWSTILQSENQAISLVKK